MYKKIIISLLVLFYGLVYSKDSMQHFFDKIYYQDNNKLINKEEFPALQLELEKFIKNGGDVNEFFIHPKDPAVNLTLLKYASFNAHIELVQYLLAKGANPLLKNNQGVTLFYFMSLKLFYVTFYMPCVDMDECILLQLKTFEALLDVIDVQEHKNIFKDWVLLIKHFDSFQSFYQKGIEDEFYELYKLKEDVSFLDEWLHGKSLMYRLSISSVILQFISGLLEKEPN